MKSFKLFLFVSFGITALLFSGCKKEDNPPTDEHDHVHMGFEFNYVVDGAAYDTSTVYTINGTAVKFSIANFYLGGITFMSEEGVPTEVKDKYLLVTPTSGMQEVGELEKGHYHMARFFIGVDSVINSQSEQDFATRSEDPNDPLGVQSPSMHWNWNSGYKFIRVDGKVDTDADGVPEQAMSFHLGKNEMLKTLQFVTHKDVEEGHDGHMHFEFDLAKAFEGIDLSQEYFTHALSSQEIPLATKFRDNLGSAFQYKHQ
ncbi:MAG: hypothetical protein KDD10_00780 [Phaeodactylibacter sp.]|nr:hypothetical protein [Phaeodactylibacter sp.]